MWESLSLVTQLNRFFPINVSRDSIVIFYTLTFLQRMLHQTVYNLCQLLELNHHIINRTFYWAYLNIQYLYIYSEIYYIKLGAENGQMLRTHLDWKLSNWHTPQQPCANNAHWTAASSVVLCHAPTLLTDTCLLLAACTELARYIQYYFTYVSV